MNSRRDDGDARQASDDDSIPDAERLFAHLDTEPLPKGSSSRRRRSSSSGSGKGSSSGSRSGSSSSSRAQRRPLLKSARFWVPMSILVVLIGGVVASGLAAKHLYDQAMSAKADLEKAMPLVSQVQKSMLDGDSAGAKHTVAQISALTTAAAKKTSGGLWRGSEWVPVAGANLTAVRVTAESVNLLVKDAVSPLTAIDLQALMPKDGAIDVANLTVLAGRVQTADKQLQTIKKNLRGLDRPALIPQVASAVTKLDSAINRIEPILTPAHNALTLLPKALGANGPQHYLLIFQNNAESRGTGGNPAAIALLTAENGKISMTQQASSTDFTNGRTDPIIPLNPETQALYGTKIGRYIQDSTLSPNFSETAQIVRAYWAETYGTPIDAVASMDPVALSYLLRAIGPVTMTTGDVLTADNAVPLLLNEVYARYPDPAQQDAFFASAAESVFSALLSAHADPKALLNALAQAANEGRLMYSPDDPAEAAMLSGTPVGGNMPMSNTGATVLGVYIDDITEGKLDYYMQMGIAATSTQCEKSDTATFTSTVTMQNTLDPAAVPDLPTYISPGRFFPKGDVSTDTYLYGPVGSTLTGATVNGQPVAVTPMPHLGRTAVKVNVQTAPGQTATIAATFTAPAGVYGPLEVRHTPMVRQTPVTLETPGCPAAK